MPGYERIQEGSRTSLLINCSAAEAQQVRDRAEFERRTVSAYVRYIVIRGITSAGEMGLFRYGLPKQKPTHPRTTLHVYCSVQEAARIRTAAREAKISISGLVSYFLWHTWKAQSNLKQPQATSSNLKQPQATSSNLKQPPPQTAC